MLLCTIALLLTTRHVAVALPQMPDSRGAANGDSDYEASLRENFNPSLANAYHNITCVGDHYNLQLPVQEGWDPNEKSMQQLCAKPQYDGGLEGQHVGGWCNHNEIMFDDSPDAKISTQLANPRVLLGCRYRCFCNHNIPIDQRNVQPKPSEFQEALQLKEKERESFQTYEIRLDVQNDFTTPLDTHKGSFGDIEVDVLRLSRFQEVRHPESLRNPHRNYVSEDEGNKITCTGDLPTFRLPSPYSVTPPNSDFQNNQQLCAVQLNGGLLGANAGGYCHRSDKLDPTGSFPLQSVWFSDEMTPRLDWTWSGGGGSSFFAAASIRAHCYRNCRCTYGKSQVGPSDTERLWQFVEGHQLAFHSSGEIVLEPINGTGNMGNSSQGSTDNNGGSGSGSGSNSGTSSSNGDDVGSNSGSNSVPGGSGSGSGSGGNNGPSSGNGAPPAKRPKTANTLMTILPAQLNRDNSPAQQGRGPSGTCGADRSQFCPQPWPSSLLGPIPSAPPDATEIVAPSPADPPPSSSSSSSASSNNGKPGLTVCGNRCEGPQDCGQPQQTKGTDAAHQCVCAYPNAKDARTLGLDPVSPASVCLALVTLAFGHAAKSGKQTPGGKLGGRDVVIAPPLLPSSSSSSMEYVPAGQSWDQDWLCRCNATFTHNVCCGSRTGMVWLD